MTKGASALIFFQDTTLRTSVAGSLNLTGMERTRLLPAYGLADNAANAANGHILARRVLLVIAATLALAATTAGTAAGLREVGPRDALAGFEITMQGAVGGAVRYEFARKGASGGAGEVESY